MSRKISIFSLLTALGVLLVVLMGAVVTNTGSNLGCGHSWPLCYGEVIPPSTTMETFIELSHRAVSGLVGLMVLAQTMIIFIKYKHLKGAKWMAVIALLFIALQAVLGGMAVIWSQSSFILALHFGFSLIAFAASLIVALMVYEQSRWGRPIVQPTGKPFLINMLLLLIYIYVVVYSGAFVRHTDSALGCATWPLCNGEIIPELYSRAGIQFIHRAMAGILFIWTLLTFITAWVKYHHLKALFNSLLIGIVLLLCQIVTGALVVLTKLGLFYLLAHSFFVTCLFGVISLSLLLTWRSKNKQIQ